LGDEVATLVEGTKPAGDYSISWDAKNCASGVYICSLKSGTETRRMKILLIK